MNVSKSYYIYYLKRLVINFCRSSFINKENFQFCIQYFFVKAYLLKILTHLRFCEHQTGSDFEPFGPGEVFILPELLFEFQKLL